jgi:hypothetical protein
MSKIAWLRGAQWFGLASRIAPCDERYRLGLSTTSGAAPCARAAELLFGVAVSVVPARYAHAEGRIASGCRTSIA